MSEESREHLLGCYGDRLIEGDCCELMESMPEGSVDLVFADPPYNLQLGGSLERPDTSKVMGVDEDWDSFESFGAYDAFSRRWLKAARRLLKADGSLWVMGSYHNIYRLGSILQDLGYWILNDVVWVKNNPMPNFLGRRLTNAHETLLWASRSEKSRYQFNYDALKSMNEGIQMRSDWYFPLCTGGERLKDGDGHKVHPTQKPESLLYRILLGTSLPGDVVLDPFVGTGTTAAVAKKTGRHYVGIDRSGEYIKWGEKRLKEIVPPTGDAEITTTPTRRKEKQIPFGHLVETGWLRAGVEIVSDCKRYKAEVQADGSIKMGDHHGSIHKIGALVQGKPSCNGWRYWHVDEENGKTIPIDDLRSKLRSKLKESVAVEGHICDVRKDEDLGGFGERMGEV
jgi:modification methylase